MASSWKPGFKQRSGTAFKGQELAIAVYENTLYFKSRALQGHVIEGEAVNKYLVELAKTDAEEAARLAQFLTEDAMSHRLSIAPPWDEVWEVGPTEGAGQCRIFGDENTGRLTITDCDKIQYQSDTGGHLWDRVR